MGLIVQAAKLVLCETCKAHGCIVFGDGSKSEEFFTDKDALAMVAEALLAKKVLSAEAEFLREEIYRSTLLTEEQFQRLKQTLLAHLHPSEGEAEAPSHVQQNMRH